jgi:UbiD family decarboxylase
MTVGSPHSLRVAALSDLRLFIEASRERGELEVIRGADPHLEIGALYELSLRHRYPPVLLFEDIVGCAAGMRVVVNTRFSRIFNGEISLDALKAFRARGKSNREPIPPRDVITGPIFENVLEGAEVDALKFPAPQWHDHDGGKYIGTECLCIVKDPESDWVNLGTYRTKVVDGKTLAVFIEPGKHGSIIRQKYWDRGESCPMVLVVGQAPVLGNVAGTSLRFGVSEFAAAGALIGEPIAVVRGKVTGLPIPADAELAFEGFVPPMSVASASEGPFGEWPGYYASGPHPEPVLQIEAIYHRNDPIVTGQPPTKPTLPGRQPSIAGMAAIWDALENAGIPGVTGVWKPLGGGVRFANVISIKQMYPGHAKSVGLVAAGSGASAYLGRITIIVDEDIDITDHAEVMWALSTRWDPKTQTDIIDGGWSGHIDPILTHEQHETGDLTTSRIIIYAVRPFHTLADPYPRPITIEKHYLDDVAAKWKTSVRFLSTSDSGPAPQK